MAFGGLLQGNEECPHYIRRHVISPSSFTPVEVDPVKLSSVLLPWVMSWVFTLPVIPLLARSAFWIGASTASGRVSIS